MGTNEISQIEEFHSKEALFGNMVKPVSDVHNHDKPDGT